MLRPYFNFYKHRPVSDHSKQQKEVSIIMIFTKIQKIEEESVNQKIPQSDDEIYTKLPKLSVGIS